jgi:hypothetical protein
VRFQYDDDGNGWLTLAALVVIVVGAVALAFLRP